MGRVEENSLLQNLLSLNPFPADTICCGERRAKNATLTRIAIEPHESIQLGVSVRQLNMDDEGSGFSASFKALGSEQGN